MRQDPNGKRNDIFLRRICIFFMQAALLGMLASCAQTVHIHPGKLAEGKVQEVREALKVAGFRSIVHGNLHPSPEMGALLIYFPEKNSTENLNKLNTVLTALGIPIDNTVSRKLYTHEYTKYQG